MSMQPMAAFAADGEKQPNNKESAYESMHEP